MCARVAARTAFAGSRRAARRLRRPVQNGHAAAEALAATSTPGRTRILSRAMAMTRVVIAQKVEESGGQEQLAALSRPLPNAALGAAPFPLLNEPSRRFDRFMAFKEGRSRHADAAGRRAAGVRQ